MVYPNYFQSAGINKGFVGEEAQESINKEKRNEITVFGVKIGYAKAFGIVFLILFILLFFPGIGVSSSSVKSIDKVNKEGTSGLKSTNQNKNNHM